MKKAFIAIAMLGFMGSTFAAGYGEAGCGLGSMAFGNQKGFVQIFAATLNGTSGNQTFGMTTGTSNCSGLGKEVTAFIDANKSSLKNDSAKGYGETIVSLSEMFGCADSKKLGKSLQENYSDVFKSTDAREIYNTINTVIVESEVSCKELV